MDGKIERPTGPSPNGVPGDNTERVMVLDNLGPNDAFFQKILHQGLQDPTIHDVVLVEKKPAVKEGENYFSNLTRVILNYICNTQEGQVSRTAHLILKEEPDVGEDTLKSIREMNVFNTEREVLKEVVPQIEKLVGRRLGPKLYYSSVEPQTIIMEDLVALGFQTRNRKVGLNEAEMFMVLENLADFHAGSVFLNEQNPGSFSHFSRGLISDKTAKPFLTYIRKGLAAIGDGVRTWKNGNFISISDKLKKLSPEIIEKVQEAHQCDANELQVLNHGDMWVNNIMIRDDDDGRPQEARFIDYQVCIWTSPAIDLLFFLSIAPEFSIKMTHDDIFLRKYLSRLSCTMENMGCSANSPTLEQLKKSMYKRRIHAIMAGVVFHSKSIAEDKDFEPLEDMIQSGGSTYDLLKNPNARRTLQKILPILDEKGYLD